MESVERIDIERKNQLEKTENMKGSKKRMQKTNKTKYTINSIPIDESENIFESVPSSLIRHNPEEIIDLIETPNVIKKKNSIEESSTKTNNIQRINNNFNEEDHIITKIGESVINSTKNLAHAEFRGNKKNTLERDIKVDEDERFCTENGTKNNKKIIDFSEEDEDSKIKKSEAIDKEKITNSQKG